MADKKQVNPADLVVRIRHKDGGEVATSTQLAFDTQWKERGYVIVEDETAQVQANADSLVKKAAGTGGES